MSGPSGSAEANWLVIAGGLVREGSGRMRARFRFAFAIAIAAVVTFGGNVLAAAAGQDQLAVVPR